MKQRLQARLQDLRFMQSIATSAEERAEIQDEIEEVLAALDRCGG